MKTISIINLKGGVGKTISAINIAYILTAVYKMRVLLIDNDKQGNLSKFFNLHNDDSPGMSEIMTVKGIDAIDLIKTTAYEGLDIITANMSLLHANREVLIDQSRPQQTRLKMALTPLGTKYDYSVIDCAPDINMSIINALVASCDVLIPIKIDNFAFDGLKELAEQISIMKDAFNPDLSIKGCFITMAEYNNVNASGMEWLKNNTDYPVFKTFIRKTVKVDETTFVKKPLLEYARKSSAGRDYEALVGEYLKPLNCDRNYHNS